MYKCYGTDIVSIADDKLFENLREVRVMRHQTLILYFLVSALLMPTTSFAGENMGVVRNIDKIAGNGFKWDHVLLFDIRKQRKIARALQDVERHVPYVGDRLVRVGANGNCVIATIITSDPANKLVSKYADATDHGELVRTSSFSRWNSGLGNQIAFDEVSLRDICR